MTEPEVWPESDDERVTVVFFEAPAKKVKPIVLDCLCGRGESCSACKIEDEVPESITREE